MIKEFRSQESGVRRSLFAANGSDMDAGTALLRNLARGFSMVLVGAVLAPLIENWRAAPRDNFPLSYYPMFSARRSKRSKFTISSASM
ncbi:hypothetical protein HC891_23350 [Candidatus Gracilibacteria bacterium]|nr:hypothetical protein [Candidatus Gracilibacteria bacterium]